MASKQRIQYILCRLSKICALHATYQYSINIARLLNHLDTLHFNHSFIESINRYCELTKLVLKQSHKEIIHR